MCQKPLEKVKILLLKIRIHDKVSISGSPFSKQPFIQKERKDIMANEYRRDPNEDMVDRILKRKDKSYLNFLLIAANIVMFVIVGATGGSNDPDNMLRWGAAYTPLISSGEYYRLFTSMFLHFGLEHLLSNMLLLFFIGDYLERYLGRIGYLILYVCGGLYAGWFSYRHELAAGGETLSAGASGAIFAVVGGLLVLVIINRGRLEDLTLQRVFLMVVFSLWVGFRSEGVDGFAHLGGFIGGVILTLLMAPLSRLFKHGKQEENNYE